MGKQGSSSASSLASLYSSARAPLLRLYDSYGVVRAPAVSSIGSSGAAGAAGAPGPAVLSEACRRHNPAGLGLLLNAPASRVARMAMLLAEAARRCTKEEEKRSLQVFSHKKTFEKDYFYLFVCINLKCWVTTLGEISPCWRILRTHLAIFFVRFFFLGKILRHFFSTLQVSL